MNIIRTLCSLSLLSALSFFPSACGNRPLSPQESLKRSSKSALASVPNEINPFGTPSPATTPSQDHTIKLLRNTVIKSVDWPEQTLADRLVLIQQEASKVGLTVDTSKNISKLLNKYCPPLKFRNIYLGLAIKYTVDCTILCYRITDKGVIYFFDVHENPPESKKLPQEVNDPFRPQSEQDIAPNAR
jgi:hypothetical protein